MAGDSGLFKEAVSSATAVGASDNSSSLAAVKHQDRAVRQIQRALALNRLPHGYLFHGSDGVGKGMLAERLGQILLCARSTEISMAKASTGESRHIPTACGVCVDCRAALAGTHPDLHIAHRYLNREHPDSDVRKRKGLEFGVDVLRHFVIDRVYLTPVRGRAKVFVIEEADRLSTQAQNALLKTLEEPPGPTYLILLTCQLGEMLATVRSRCQEVAFNSLPMDFVRSRLTELSPGLSVARANWHARASEGSLGLALRSHEDGWFEVNERLLHGLDSMLSSHRAAAKEPERTGGSAARSGTRSDRLAREWLKEAAELGEKFRGRDPDLTDTDCQRRGLSVLFRLASTWFGDAMHLLCGDSEALTNREHREIIERALCGAGAGILDGAVDRVRKAERQLDLNANAQLCVECLLNEWKRMFASASSNSRRVYA